MCRTAPRVEGRVEIHLDRTSDVPLYVQIARGVRAMIVAGRLPTGSCLPPERSLARALGLSRDTVVAAYRELRADGLVDAHVGRGTTVAAPQDHSAEGGHAPSLPWRQLFGDATRGVEDPILRDLLELSERPDVISLSLGLPAPDLLPMAAFGEVHEALLEKVGPGLLLHSPTEGLTPFRESLVELAAARGIACSLHEILVVSGSQQGLHLVSRVLLAPGDEVIVEEPTFFGALQVFRAAQARILGVPVDGDGMRTDVLETLLQRHRPKLIYSLPTFQNPSGTVMSLARRRRLLDLARRYQVPILEDDPYSELRYEGPAIPPLKALDSPAGGHVIYLSSFSKVLFPGLRVGWMIGAPPLVRQVALAKQSVDLHTSTHGQWLLDGFLRAGHFRRHVEAVREAYRARRGAMEESLEAAMPSGFTWTRPQGGFYCWCRLPEGVSLTTLLVAAGRRQVSFLPGTVCFPGDGGRRFVRLNFTFPSPADIREGVRRLADALTSASEGESKRDGSQGTRPIV